MGIQSKFQTIYCQMHKIQLQQMGNQCCETGRYTVGDLPKNKSKHHYSFQQDHDQISNPIINSSKATTHAPPNEYSQRQPCIQPKINNTLKDLLASVSAGTFASVGVERGVPDGQFYQFKRSGNIYQGEWKRELPHGVGILYFLKGSVYVGSFIQGVPFGRGRLVMNSAAYYEGDIRYGKANGQGQFRDGEYVYKGHFKDDMKHGEGVEKEETYVFKGTFGNGQKLYGVYKYESCIYEGQFENEEFNGKGRLQNEDGSSYKGSFKSGRFHGYGEFKWGDGSQYRGSYYMGEREGDGEFFNSKNSSISRGIWSEGMLKGQGQYKDHRGKVIKCIWQKGKMTGIKTS